MMELGPSCPRIRSDAPHFAHQPQRSYPS